MTPHRLSRGAARGLGFDALTAAAGRRDAPQPKMIKEQA